MPRHPDLFDERVDDCQLLTNVVWNMKSADPEIPGGMNTLRGLIELLRFLVVNALPLTIEIVHIPFHVVARPFGVAGKQIVDERIDLVLDPFWSVS